MHGLLRKLEERTKIKKFFADIFKNIKSINKKHKKSSRQFIL